VDFVQAGSWQVSEQKSTSCYLSPKCKIKSNSLLRN
jgi:hypothetical protein